MTAELVGWLLVQLADDEGSVISGGCCCGDGPARPDCADRIMVEVDAKRRIIAEHYIAEGYDGHHVDAPVCGRCSGTDISGAGFEGDPYPCVTLRLLALPYADRSGYRQEWAPGWLTQPCG